MLATDFFFDLPEELIAQRPPAERGRSRLMLVDRAASSCRSLAVADLAGLVEPGTLMVFNDSRVRKARLYASSPASGAAVEFLLLEKLGPDRWRTMANRAKRRRTGQVYAFPDGVSGEIEAEDGEFRIVRFDRPIGDDWLDAHGHLPLPPYIKREDEAADAERYQTVYARTTGSAAAPTAGLHFTPELLAGLDARGIERATVTLHVGLGTFLPVRTEQVEDHRMHEERFHISEAAAAAVERAKAEGRPVLAVGTTSVRTLESAWRDGRLVRGDQTTSIFIYPGYRFKVVDRLFTNFHTPGSTLLMLVSAFAGRDLIMDSYRRAVGLGFRFFSYGDAMLIV
jgi:S-adenosylmethionine:tRNA ribosyltransferase-isomerase